MDILSIFLVAVGLAIDALAVSIATGITPMGQRRKNGLVMASFFAGFQVIMPLIGWSIGLNLQSLIANVDHWVAFAILTFIGAKMIYDYKKDCDSKNSDLKLASLLTLSVATSIDALMVGLSFAFIQASIILPIVVIGVVTFSLSFTGFIFGCKIGQVFGCRIKILGGLILIGIGVKILLDAFN